MNVISAPPVGTARVRPGAVKKLEADAVGTTVVPDTGVIAKPDTGVKGIDTTLAGLAALAPPIVIPEGMVKEAEYV
jgi:hypothetical protein